MEQVVKISVRNLVEFIQRSGDIDSTYIGAKRAQEGILVHQKIQKKRKKQALLNNEVYESEFSLKFWFNHKNFKFMIEGRADGILKAKDTVTIEEIKSTFKPLNEIENNPNHWHWSQVKCYGYMYCILFEQEKINLMMTYCSVESNETAEFYEAYTKEELEVFFYDLIERYYVFAQLDYERIQKRDTTAKILDFPYEQYRKSQRELAVSVYTSIKQSKKLFVQAPTGTGKTISTLFPSIKSLSEGLSTKIFYLTSKTITRQVAEEALSLMEDKGLKLCSITLTAKEKICFNERCSCNPVDCKHACGHFDRVNPAILDMIRNETLIRREVIEAYAHKHCVCPFEFSFDIALFCDVIICDYNYFYDPKAQLKRFFSEGMKNDFVMLHDEAHNLVDRSRDMYSAILSKSDFSNIRKQLKNKKSAIYAILGKIISCIREIGKEYAGEEKNAILTEQPEMLYYLLLDFLVKMDKWLLLNQGDALFDEMINLYFLVLDFLRIYEFFDERYVVFIETEKSDVRIKLLCLDPSYLLSQTQKRVKSCVFFSATLTPLHYFKSVFGGDEKDYTLKFSSPFDPKNLNLIIDAGISTKYINREASYEKIADRLYSMVMSKKGNYFAFFSSYAYLDSVFSIFEEKYPEIKTLIQAQNMSEEHREEFLNQITPDSELLIFAVLGGLFAEGIDLVGERLIGAAIIGVGLPLITTERNVVSDYYKRLIGKGFEYAYVYPGMNKVLQAAGRVIRSEKDRGIVLLIDNRFLNSAYRDLFPREWAHYKRVPNAKGFDHLLADFWVE